jgi:hypothetical protein
MCELVIQTAIKNGDLKMNDTEILKKVKDWLKSNLEGGDIDQIDIEEDNKALLDAIEDWQN